MASRASCLAESLVDLAGTASPVTHAKPESSVASEMTQQSVVSDEPYGFKGEGTTALRLLQDVPAAPRVRSLRVQPMRKPKGVFVAVARWEGVVESVNGDEFDVRLTDIAGVEQEVQATFSKEDVSVEDMPLLAPGAVFYWLVGYYDNASGQRTRVAELKFRRLPVRRSRNLARALDKAEAIRRELGL